MIIRFRQSGGYAAGVTLGNQAHALDTASMDSADAEALQSLLNRSGLLDQSATTWRSPQAADAMQYEISIEDKGTVRRFAFDDMSVPESVIPLLEYLLDRCSG